MYENQSLAELPNHHRCHVLYLLEVVALSDCFQTQLRSLTEVDGSESWTSSCETGIRNVTTMASFPLPSEPNTKCSTFNVHTHVFHRGDLSRLRITFLTPLVHFFGAQYNTIFPRYTWEHVIISGPVRSRPNSRAMCCTKYSEKSPLHNRN